jgi:hypothetical protein
VFDSATIEKEFRVQIFRWPCLRAIPRPWRWGIPIVVGMPLLLAAGCVSSMISDWNMLRGFGKKGYRERIQVGGESPFVDLSHLRPGNYCKVSLRDDERAASYQGYVQSIDSEKVVLIDADQEAAHGYQVPVASKVPWLNRIFRKTPDPEKAVTKTTRVKISLSDIEQVESLPGREMEEPSEIPDAYVISED